MQPKIPLFSSPAIVKVPPIGEESPLTVIDLRNTEDKDVTRLLTLYVQATDEVIADLVVLYLGSGNSIIDFTAFVGAAIVTGTSHKPVKILDEYPVRGDVVLSAINSSVLDGEVFMFGYYTIAGTAGQRFNVLDKRALQPNNTLPTVFSLPIVGGDNDEDVSVHTTPVPTARDRNEYLDEVTVDVTMNDSTEVRLFFEDYPDNYIAVRPYTAVPSDPLPDPSGLITCFDGIPFRAQGVLKAQCSTPDDPEAAPANISGFFVRY